MVLVVVVVVVVVVVAAVALQGESDTPRRRVHQCISVGYTLCISSSGFFFALKRTRGERFRGRLERSFCIESHDSMLGLEIRRK